MNLLNSTKTVLAVLCLVGIAAFATIPVAAHAVDTQRLVSITHDQTPDRLPDRSRLPSGSSSGALTKILALVLAVLPLVGVAVGTGAAGSRFPTMEQAAGILQSSNWDINSLMGDWVDRGPWEYYDTLYVPSTGVLAATYAPFQVKIGLPDAVTAVAKTKLQTNMVDNGSFGATRCLILQQLGFTFPSYLPKAACDLIMNSMFFEVRIAEKIFWEGLPEGYPGGTGMYGVTTQTGEETWTISMPLWSAARLYERYAKYIAPLIPVTWSLNFIGASGTAPTLPALGSPGTGVNVVNGSTTYTPFLKVWMTGLTDRAVQ